MAEPAVVTSAGASRLSGATPGARQGNSAVAPGVNGPLLRLVRDRCPVVLRFLRRTGYEDALAVRGCTHLALWCSSLISVVFVAVWFSDVFTLRCLTTAGSMPELTCIYEAVGVLIFFATFRDSIRMIAHFDDDRQQVLRRKWQQLEMLRIDSQHVLDSAKASVESLRSKVVEMMRDRIEEYTQEVFTVILPILQDELRRLQTIDPGGQASRDAEARFGRLVRLLRSTPQEVDDIADAMLQDLAQDNPEVYGVLLEEKGPKGQALAPWDWWLGKEFPSLDLSGPPGPCKSQPANLVSEAASPMPVGREVQYSREVARSVMLPVEELLATPGKLEKRFEKLLRWRSSNSWSRGQRMGVGTPPWGHASGAGEHCLSCRCCLPRIVAILGSLCRGCCCFCCSGSCCQSGWRHGFVYPPKRLKIGPFWLQIHTKLHGRLLQGLIFSTLYLASYLGTVLNAYLHFSRICSAISADDSGHEALRSCMLDILHKVVGALALACYIPALLLCLSRIDRLDSVMEAIKTIWELEDVHQAMSAFNRRMLEVAEHVVLLKAIGGRVLTRVDLVMQFGRKLGSLVQLQADERPRRIRECVQQLADGMEFAGLELRPAAEWLHLSQEEQDFCLQEAFVKEAVGRRSRPSTRTPAGLAQESAVITDATTFSALEEGKLSYSTLKPADPSSLDMSDGTFSLHSSTSKSSTQVVDDMTFAREEGRSGAQSSGMQ